MENRPDSGNLGPSEYLLYRVLVERYDQDNQETGRTKFFKLSCLSNALLQDEYDRDVGLPWHWYKYGGAVEAHSFDRSILFAPNANHQDGQAYYPANAVDESDFDIDDELAADIQEAVQLTVEENGEKDRDELERLQYRKFAPNEFILLYSDLRWGLVSLVLEDVDYRQRSLFEFPMDDTHYITEILDEMLREFPKEDYENIYEQYLVWDDTMRLLVESDAPPEDLHDFLEMFITRISEVTLRFVHRHNIPRERLKEWKEKRPNQLEKLDDSIQEIRTGLLNDSPRSEILSKVSEAYNRTIQEQISEL